MLNRKLKKSESKLKTWNKGILFVVSAPSGAGKTTVVEKLLAKDSSLSKTISHTTRLPRPGEKNGRDYFFVSEKKFGEMVSKKEFVEWVHIYHHRYGTSKKTIQEKLQKGKDVLLVIEAKGAKEIQKQFPQSVFVLLLPPGVQELRQRIFSRKDSSQNFVKDRLREAKKEVRAMQWYDYVVINGQVDQAVRDLESIVRSERNRLSRKKTLVQQFLSS